MTSQAMKQLGPHSSLAQLSPVPSLVIFFRLGSKALGEDIDSRIDAFDRSAWCHAHTGGMLLPWTSTHTHTPRLTVEGT